MAPAMRLALARRTANVQTAEQRRAGQTVTISVTLTGPSTPGNVVVRERMLQGTSNWFTTVQDTNVNVTVPPLSSSFSNVVVPKLVHNQKATFSVTIVNNSTSTWYRAGANRVDLAIYFNGRSDAIGDWPSTPPTVKLPNDVAPGQSVTVSVTTTAPPTAGNYVLRMRLLMDSGNYFPSLYSANVVVT